MSPSVEPTLPPPLLPGFILMPRSELLGLPTSGAAWHALKSVADDRWGKPDLCNGESGHGPSALAGALVYARTGLDFYYTKTRNAIMAATRTPRSSCTMLAIGRQLGAYVLAADLVSLKAPDVGRFRAWLTQMRTGTFTGHPRWQTLVGTHDDSANNWGAFAGASRIAVDLYLGDRKDLGLAAHVLRGFLGDGSAWHRFRGQGDTNVTLPQSLKAWACDPSAGGFLPVNPACTKSGIDLDGAIVSDISRDDQGLTWPAGPTGIGYTLESLQGLVLQSELLYRNGFPDVWSWSDCGLRRIADLVTRNGKAGGRTWNTSSVNYYVPWLLNFRYGLDLPTMEGGYGRIFGYTDWLYGGRGRGDQWQAVVPASSNCGPATLTKSNE